MRAGTGQVDITPSVGIELSGFALRQQPSTGVLDPLYAKALYLEADGRRLLWIHSDLIGLEATFVRTFRDHASRQWGLDDHEVLLSATHTHAGPPTVYLFEAGRVDATYLRQLHAWFEEAAEQAMAAPAECRASVGITQVDLAVDRRRMPSSHVDPQLAVVGLLDRGGDYRAIIVNYAMHPVALGAQNRLISADYCGEAASALANRLPGHPVVLMTNGACGNLNPPAQNISTPQLREWGGRIADAAAEALGSASLAANSGFSVRRKCLVLPAQDRTIQAIESHAHRFLTPPGGPDDPATSVSQEIIDRAARHWRTRRMEALGRGEAIDVEAEIFILRLGGLNLIGINAEVFSCFTGLVRREIQEPVCTLGYANGVMGYLPTRQAYAEGGYEVNTAMFFYDVFRPEAGSLERLASDAVRMIQKPPR